MTLSKASFSFWFSHRSLTTPRAHWALRGFNFKCITAMLISWISVWQETWRLPWQAPLWPAQNFSPRNWIWIHQCVTCSPRQIPVNQSLFWLPAHPPPSPSLPLTAVEAPDILTLLQLPLSSLPIINVSYFQITINILVLQYTLSTHNIPTINTISYKRAYPWTRNYLFNT